MAQVGDFIFVTSRSESRVTRNCEGLDPPAGNISARCARITLVSSTKAWRPSDTWGGSLMTRGSTRGTLTMAMRVSRPSASLPDSRTMKCSDLFATCGKGAPGPG